MNSLLKNALFSVISLVILNTTFAQNYEWGNVPIGGGGFVSAVIMSKTVENLVYARTDVGGAYRWDNENSKWIPLTDWVSEEQTGYLGVESLALDPNNDAIVYMLVGISYFNNGNTAILKSTDYGETFSIVNVSNQFKAHGNGMGRQNGEKLVVDPNNSNILYCGTRWNGLFKSTNAGETWSKVPALNVTTTPNENGISLVVLDKSKAAGGNTQTLYIGVSKTGSNFYKTTNGGQTFTEVTGGPANLMPQRASLASDGNMYITYADGAGPHGHWAVPEPMENGQVWKYNTTSGVWTNITPAGYTRAFGGVNVDPTNPNRVIISTINTYLLQDNAYGDRVLLTTNGGTSWTDVMKNGVDIQPNGVTWIDGHAIHWAGSVEFDPFDTKKVWITSGNGVFVNDNIATSPSLWRFEVDGLEETVPLDIESIKGGPLVSVIGDYDGFTHSDVTDYAPIHTPRMGTTTGLDIAELNTNIRLRVGNDMYYTLNGGTTWTKATINGVKGRVAVSADGKTFLHSPEKSSVTYYSSNNGSSWSTSSGLSFSEAKPTADPINATKFYAYNPSNGTMYVSTNAGQSFTAAGNVGTNGSKIIRLNPNVEGDLWVAMYNGGLKHSTNSGQSFSTISGVTQCGAVGLGKAAPSSDYPTLFIWGTVNGVQGIYRSIDKGVSWTRVNDDTHEYGGPGNGQFVIGDWNEYGRVYMSTAGRGIVTGVINGVDCNNDQNGTAFIDNCEICAGGNTNIEPNSTCVQDCNNDWGGDATLDNCNVCTGGNTGIEPNSTCPQPCGIDIQNQTICKEGIVELTIVETGNFAWYTNESDIEPIEVGNKYSPFIDATSTLYVERETKQITHLGEINKTGTGWADNTFPNDDKKIKIIVAEKVKIKAVHVFTTIENTQVTIRITSLADGKVVGEGNVTATAIGKTKVDLNVDLNPGEYFIDAVGTTESLFYQTEKGNFPYSIDGVISFTYNASWASTWYGFFYDWEIEQGKSCIKTPVTVTIDPQDSSCSVTGSSSSVSTENSAYPNPFSSNINLNVKNASKYIIYNSYGVSILSGDCLGNCLIGDDLKSGVYHLVVTDNGNVSTKVIIKQ